MAIELENDYLTLCEGESLSGKYLIEKAAFISELSVVYTGYSIKDNRKCIIKEFYPRKLVLRDMDRKTVVCKMPSQKSRYNSHLEAFFNEASVLRQLDHSNILRYIDHFKENNTGYIVTEYCEGITLDEFIKEEKEVSIPDFLKNIYIPILNAVMKMHKIGILHRDIKPTNIIICPDNVPVLIDFGSAINFKQCKKKEIFVTRGFSPLEFYSEKSRQGKYSDIYGLAATLYYYLSGFIPDDAGERVIVDNLKSIRRLNDQITPLFSGVIMKNLSIDYKKRFGSLKPFKLFVYIEYLILKLRDRLSHEKSMEC
jgi:serine/threonine protein kinase